VWDVSPWPYPRPDALPALHSGAWHREGFIAAVLTGTELLEGPAAAQRERLEEFLLEAISASRTLLGSSHP
jgi:hypothetical protein